MAALVLCVLAAPAGARAAGAATAPGPSQGRLEKLLAAVEHKSWLVQHRAIQELAPLVSRDARVRKALLEKLVRDTSSPTQDVAFCALGQVEGPGVGEVIQAYRDANSDDRQELRPVLGRMGERAKAAAPLLRKELAAAGADPNQAAAIRVALAQLGAAEKDDLAAIARDLSSPQRPGEGALRAMCLAGRNEWVDAGIKRALIAALGRDDDNRFLAAMALGTLGRKADPQVVDALAKAFDAAMKRQDKEVGYLTAGLPLALIDPGRRKATLRAVLKTHHEDWSRVTVGIMLWLSAGITDEAVIRDVIDLLADRDVAVSIEAAQMLGRIGPRAAAGTEKLLAMAASAPQTEQREAAAKALGYVAAPADVAKLRTLIRKLGKDSSVAAALAESVKVVELE
jgi:hypothetical protein